MNRWNVSQGLEQEARQVINMLENANVPPDGLNNFTVGDSFRNSLLHLKHDIISLASDTRLLESTVVGGFGTGKTHFLSYLHWHLEKDVPKDCVISRVDMSKLRDPHDLQKIRGR